MPIRHAHTIDIKARPERAFALLDDLEKTPLWLERCAALAKAPAGPTGLGTTVRYSYRERGHSGMLAGIVTAHVPNEHLALRYAGPLLELDVDFRLEPSTHGTRLTHALEMRPKTVTLRVLAPLIRRELARDAARALERLRRMLEA